MAATDDVQPVVPDANVARLLADAVERVGDRPALVRVDEHGDTREVIAFDRLHRLVGAVAGGLRERGIARSSRVVVALPMGLELYVAVLAALRLGAVVAHVEPWSGRRAVERAATALGADAFVGAPRSFALRLLSPALRRIEVAVSTGSRRVPGTERFADLLAAPAHRHVLDCAPVHADDPALVTFTAGADQASRGAIRTHGILLAQHRAIARQAPKADAARVWTNLPVVGLHGVGRGATVILPPRGRIGHDPVPDPKRLHQLVERSGASVLALGPAQLAQLVRAPGRAPLHRVEQVWTGGGPVTADLLRAARAVLPSASIAALHGSPEAAPIARADADEVLERCDRMRLHGGIYVGREVDGADVLVVRAERGPIELEPGSSLRDWTVADGAPGELLVAGDHVTRDCWGDPGAARRHKVRDEHGAVWHRTGDIARRDEDGGLWLLGRLGGGFALRGRRRWALEVEAPVIDLPEVARAAICMPRFTGADREFKNASAVLAVEPADGFDRRDATRATLRALQRLGLDDQIEVRSLRSIPLARHRPGEVDLSALQDRLRPENSEDY